MLLDEPQYNNVKELLHTWEQTGKISAGQRLELEKDLQLKPQDNNLSKYFFIIGISSGLLAFAAIFLEDKIIESLKQYLELNNFVIGAVATVLAAVWFYFVHRKRQQLSSFVAETYYLIGGLITLTALVYFAKDLSTMTHYSNFLLITTCIMAIQAIGFRSMALWLAALIAVSGWFGVFSTWYSENNLFLGMNYPLRFCIWGVVCLSISFVLKLIPRTEAFHRVSFSYAIITMLVALWGLSIFGNYGDFELWQGIRQTRVLIFGILLAVAALAAFFIGLKQKDSFLRDTGLLFLLLNLYTRFFEFFWDSLNKGLFFLILALSFWFAGKWLEKRKKKAAAILT